MAGKAVTVVGRHSLTAALKNVLDAKGVLAPHTNQPFSEAMLLGIGGGIGVMYILWEFQWHDGALIVLGFTNRSNYPVRFLTALCERLGVKSGEQETSGAKKAAANLQNAELPVIAWADKAHLPHHQLPEALKGHIVHIFDVHSLTGGEVIVDDLSARRFAVPADVFAAARARIGSDKNRLFHVTPPANLKIDLKAAILAGIEDEIDYLGSGSESFSLAAIKKWARLMTHPKDKKGWPVVFAARKSLYTTLRTVFEGVTLDDSDGSGLREMYAEFLVEAAGVTGSAKLNDAAKAYREAGARWRELAEAALPDSVPVFAQTKVLMRERYARYHEGDLPRMKAAMDGLAALEARYDSDFPLDAAATDALFAALQTKLNSVYDAEVAALNVLKSSI